jgi:hypothetical protein
LTKEDEVYYENYLDLFLHPGWKQFVQESKESLESHNIDEIKDQKELFLLQGRRHTLLNVIHFEAGIKNAFDMEVSDD